MEAVQAGKIKIAWSICGIRARNAPTRCYKCLKIGHTAARCRSSLDRSNLWLSCDDGAHTIRDCKNQAISSSRLRPYSSYLPSSLTYEEFCSTVDVLTVDIRNHRPAVNAGDFNAWTLEWGSSLTNSRGRALLKAFADLFFLFFYFAFIYWIFFKGDLQ